jgi:hypothetical protein
LQVQVLSHLVPLRLHQTDELLGRRDREPGEFLDLVGGQDPQGMLGIIRADGAKEGIAFEALDNGIRSCADPARLQAIGNGLSGELIEGLLREWLARLPQPFTIAGQQAGYSYALSILQLECSLTQVLDRPLTGRIFFEEVIRENLDLGRPDQVQLIFARRVTKRTPGRFRTRVITEGVTPSLHIDYKSSRIKQYHKEAPKGHPAQAPGLGRAPLRGGEAMAWLAPVPPARVGGGEHRGAAERGRPESGALAGGDGRGRRAAPAGSLLAPVAQRPA